MLEELISRSFMVRNAAQLAHWRAKGPGSYARHMALGDFYDGLIEKLDAIVEAKQGYAGELIGFVKLIGQDTTREIDSLLEAECLWLENNREDIAEKSSAVLNMLDELSGLYQSTIYKLKFLA